MTDNEINIAIAEWCGWKFRDDCSDHGCPCHKSPNYSTDLNAMHEAEKVLLEMSDGKPQPDTWDKYVEYLHHGFGLHSTLIHATARQRAEAFLKTLGKFASLNTAVGTVGIVGIDYKK